MHPPAKSAEAGPCEDNGTRTRSPGGEIPGPVTKAAEMPLNSPYEVITRHWNTDGVDVSDSLKRRWKCARPPSMPSSTKAPTE